MTVLQMSQLVGKQITVDLEGLAVSCKVKDVKTAYGKYRLLVVPVSGSGEKWIETSRVKGIQ
jgi:hypothetical protein